MLLSTPPEGSAAGAEYEPPSADVHLTQHLLPIIWACRVYISGIPGTRAILPDTVHIESRNPQDTLEAMGVKTAADGVKG